MMKRFASLALALMLLCSNTLAEGAAKLTLRLSLDEEALRAYMPEMEETVRSVGEIVDGLRVEAILGERSGYGAVYLQDELLLDIGAAEDAEAAYVSSSMFPGHCVKEMASGPDWQSVMTKTDWASVLTEVLAAIDAWTGSIESAAEEGDFSCDAYEGAKWQFTATLDDAKFAALLDSLVACLPEDIREMTETDQWSVYNSQVAEENAYSYVFKRSYAEDGRTLLGYTLLVHKDGQQLMSFSMGFASNGVRLVWGYGLNGLNRYVDVMVISGDEPDTYLAAVDVYQDPDRKGFRGVVEDYTYMDWQLLCKFSRSEDGWYLAAECMDWYAMFPYSMTVLEGDAAMREFVLDWCLPIGEEGQEQWVPCLTGTVTVTDAELPDLGMEALTQLDPEDPKDAARLDDLMNDAATALGIKLFRMLPSEFITFLMQ